MSILARKFWTKKEIRLYLLIPFLVCINVASGDQTNVRNSTSINRESFPPSFVFGVGSSAYQYEGATAEGGRKPCIWDTFIKKFPEIIQDHSDASIAADQYHRYKEDVALMKDIGVDVYRLSISWSRVLPDGGLRGGVNQEGINYYNNLINELVSNGIKPIVNLFHWDLPQALEDEYEGFLSPKIIEDFRDFAELCFKEFGDKVKIWTTFNEPMMYAMGGYSNGNLAPGRCSNRTRCTVGDSSTEPYIVGHHVILAHSAAVNVFREKYQTLQNGQIGISLNTIGMVPYSNSTKDEVAAVRAVAFTFGWYMEPLYSGSYPVEMVANVGKRLPQFTKEESDMVKGSYDFVGVNYYTSRFVADVPCPTQYITYNTDWCVSMTSERNGIPIGIPSQKGAWIISYPQGLQDMLLYIKDRYNDPIMYITENGIGDPTVTPPSIFVDDSPRIEYIESHLTRIIEAIRLGAKVEGYVTWSFLDNFEWLAGYSSGAGIVFVNRGDGLKRIPKQSALWFKSILTYQNHTNLPK